VGVDLASNLDMTAACFLWKESDGSYFARWKVWVPEETVAAREREGIPYMTWIRDGWATVTQGARLDHEHVARDILEAGEQSRIVAVGADPWQVGPLATLLQRADVEVQTVAQRTGTLNAPCKLLEALVVEGKLRTGDPPNPIAAWAANHVCVYTDPTGMIKPDKAKSAEKIDPIVALVNALAIASTSDEGNTDPSAWQIIEL
jgi:phage terminase large subunit-like protein